LLGARVSFAGGGAEGLELAAGVAGCARADAGVTGADMIALTGPPTGVCAADGDADCAAARSQPQWRQKLAPGFTSLPHWGQYSLAGDAAASGAGALDLAAGTAAGRFAAAGAEATGCAGVEGGVPAPLVGAGWPRSKRQLPQ